MVGKKIRAYREFRGLNQIQLAELSGINVGTIRKYELGLRNPKPEQLERIASALGLNVSIFLILILKLLETYCHFCSQLMIPLTFLYRTKSGR